MKIEEVTSKFKKIIVGKISFTLYIDVTFLLISEHAQFKHIL